MAKPHYTLDQGAAQLTRYLSPSYLPPGANGLTLTYAYRATETAPQGPPGTSQWIGGLNSDMGGFQAFNAAQIQVMERALDMIEDIANIRLVRVGSGTTGASAYSDQAELLLGNYTSGAAVDYYSGWAGYRFYINGSGTYFRAAKAWLDGTEEALINPTSYNKGAFIFLHEVMHALGLSHPGDYDKAKGPSTYADDAIFLEDDAQYTAMSYFDETETGANWGNNQPQTPMLYDIAALQKIYGANMATRTGDTIYGFNSNTGYDAYTFLGPTARRIFTIWDAGGNDTLDLSGLKAASTINLNEEAFSSAGIRADGGPMINNIAIARGAVIENAIGGSGNDTIIGNAARNALTGNAGDDRIEGGAGLDKAIYGGARGEFTVTTTGGAITVADSLAARSGNDTLTGVERVQFTDFTLAFDVSAAQGYRLYQAAFARTPDLGGLSYWVDRMDDGLSLRDLAYGFIASAEFRTAYGANPTNGDLVGKFYLNILGRPAEKGGFDYWVGLLDKGTNLIDVLAGISESEENVGRLSSVIGQGVVLDTATLA